MYDQDYTKSAGVFAMSYENDTWKLSELRLDPYEEKSRLVSTLLKEEVGDFVLYVEPPAKDEHMFQFICTSWVANDGDDWVHVVAYGTAYHDGIRHVRFAASKDSDMIGYFNYPDIESLALLMKRLRELEIKYCAPWEMNQTI